MKTPKRWWCKEKNPHEKWYNEGCYFLRVCCTGAELGWTLESPNQHLINDTGFNMFGKHKEYIFNMGMQRAYEAQKSSQCNEAPPMVTISLVLQSYKVLHTSSPPRQLAFPLALLNFGWSSSLTGFKCVWICLDGCSTIWRKAPQYAHRQICTSNHFIGGSYSLICELLERPEPEKKKQPTVVGTEVDAGRNWWNEWN